jgi:exonuclease III
MKIVSWNCEGGFDRKANWLFELNPDLAVVQECTERAARAQTPANFSHLWFGLPGSKGLAVFHRTDIRLVPINTPDHRWLVGLDVDATEQFSLVAVWSCPERSGLAAYVEECRNAVAAHPEWFQTGRTIMVGDFNSNCTWDSSTGGQHTLLINELAAHGMTSLYHQQTGQEFGKESVPTIHHQRKIEKPFHIDFAFVSKSFLERAHCSIGSPDIWLSRSDHCPIVIDIHSK